MMGTDMSEVYRGTVRKAGVTRHRTSKRGQYSRTSPDIGPVVFLEMDRGSSDVLDDIETPIEMSFGMSLDGTKDVTRIYHISRPDDVTTVNINSLSLIERGDGYTFSDLEGAFILEHTMTTTDRNTCKSVLWFSNDLVLEMEGKGVTVRCAHHQRYRIPRGRDSEGATLIYTAMDSL